MREMKKENSVAVAFQDITKRFPPNVIANDHISFEVEKGTIHALLGENGAGKTTLMNILYGLYQPNQGRILVNNKPARINSPQDAIALGIGMVHQHFKLVQPQSVAENIILGSFSVPFFFPLRKVKKEIAEISEKYGLKVNPQAKIWQLSAGEQQRVEILKALYRQANILILDEPTSVLTPGEIKELFKVLRAIADSGKTIIFITHKLDEVIEISDRVTVLRKGKVVGTIDTSQTRKEKLAQMMVGREVVFDIEKAPLKRGEKVLEVENLSVLNDLGLPGLRNVSFEVREGEIVGIAGVAGNGQRELAEALGGLRRALKGKIKILGKDTTNASPRELFQLGVAYIPEDRQMGLVESMAVEENLILKSYCQTPFSRIGWLNQTAVRDQAKDLIAKYKITTPEASTPVFALSGGNRQRVILARELSRKPKVVIASHPTSGLDVAATEQIRNLLLQEQKRGVGLLLISEDLEEVLALADTILVLYEGRVMGQLARKEASRQKIGLMMAGIEER